MNTDYIHLDTRATNLTSPIEDLMLLTDSVNPPKLNSKKKDPRGLIQ